MARLTAKQAEKVQGNLRAFRTNFGDVRIERNYDGFYVYYPADSDFFLQYCRTIDYLDGWLYGAVQCANRAEFRAGAEEKREG